jgi:hypothetical protein
LYCDGVSRWGRAAGDVLVKPDHHFFLHFFLNQPFYYFLLSFDQPSVFFSDICGKMKTTERKQSHHQTRLWEGRKVYQQPVLLRITALQAPVPYPNVSLYYYNSSKPESINFSIFYR